MANSTRYPYISETSVSSASWVAITAPVDGSGFMAKLRDASSWKFAVDSDGTRYFSVLSEFTDDIRIKRGDILFYAKSDAAGPLTLELLVLG